MLRSAPPADVLTAVADSRDDARFVAIELGAAHSPWMRGTRKVDIRLPEKGNSDSHGARPVY